MENSHNTTICRTIVLGLSLLWSTSCRHKSLSADCLLYFQTRVIPDVNFSSVFEHETKITFLLPDSLVPLLSISSLAINRNGDYIVLDGARKQIILFDSTGQFVRYILYMGADSNEYIARMFMDMHSNLFTYDISNRWLKKYEFPRYNGYTDSVQLAESVSSITFDSSGSVITYGLYSPHLIYKYDSNAQLTSSIGEPEDETLRKFLARFAAGNIINAPNNGIILFYPEKFRLVIYDSNFHLTTILKSPTPSKFRPDVPEFPENLSPYEMSPRHAEWWDQFLHADRILPLRDSIFAVILHQSKGITAVHYYINIYHLDGYTYAEGITLPQDGYPILTLDKFLFVSVAARTDPDNRLRLPELYRYALRPEATARRGE